MFPLNQLVIKPEPRNRTMNDVPRLAIVQNGIEAAGLPKELFQRHSALDFKADPQLLMIPSPPLDRAESRTPKEDVHETEGFDRLVPILHGRILGVPV